MCRHLPGSDACRPAGVPVASLPLRKSFRLTGTKMLAVLVCRLLSPQSFAASSGRDAWKLDAWPGIS